MQADCTDLLEESVEGRGRDSSAQTLDKGRVFLQGCVERLADGKQVWENVRCLTNRGRRLPIVCPCSPFSPSQARSFFSRNSPAIGDQIQTNKTRRRSGGQDMTDVSWRDPW